MSLANGFTDISIDDSLRAQGDDETINPLKSRSFGISGSIVGATLSEVNGNSEKIQVALQNVSNVFLTLSNGSSGSVYTVRTKSINISSPTVRNQTTSRTFKIDLVTYDDYTKEPYTLGETQQTFGNILWDVVDNVDHAYDFNEGTIGTSLVTSESLAVSGKKYYSDWSAYEADRSLYNDDVTSPSFITSPSANQIASATSAVLSLRSVKFGSLQRDGNDPTELV